MYGTKKVEVKNGSALLHQYTWLVEETLHLRELTICANAVLTAPEGKYLTLTVNGVGVPIAKGTYRGDVVLSVSDSYVMAPGGLMKVNQKSREMHAAVVVKGGKLQSGMVTEAILGGGAVTDTAADGLYIGSLEESYNGIIIDDSDYTVKNCRFDFEGFSDNDFLGVGCGVTAVGKSRVVIENCDFNFSGVTRCAIHAGGDSEVIVRGCRLINLSPDTDWLGSFSWQVGFAGSNRLAQLTDNATVTYENCEMLTNGWGICSIDGSDEGVKMTIRDSKLTLTGPRAHGYGAFCIGENEILFENSTIDVNGYPMLVMGMEGLGRPKIKGSRLLGRRFGAMVVSDDNSIFDIEDSDITTGKSSLVVKGSATIINIGNTTMNPGNGVILQLMDSDEGGMDMDEFRVPVGVADKPVAGRCLTAADEAEDVILNVTGCSWKGNIFNSTTNIRPTDNCPHGGMGYFHDTVIGIMAPPPMPEGAEAERPPKRHEDDLRGPKNLGLNLRGTRIEGVISSAVQSYAEGLTVIREDNRLELSNVTQKAAPTVNNGVVLSLDGASSWVVTGDSYITSLSLEKGASVSAPAGRSLSVTVDGKSVTLAPGKYEGRIELTVK